MAHHHLPLLLALLLLGAAMPVPAHPQQEPLEFGYIELPPFGYTNSEGEASGYLAKLSRRILSEMNQPVQFREHPASRLYRQLRSGATAFALGPEGLHQLGRAAVESKEPAITLTLAIYHRKDTPPVFYVKDLQGKRVVLMQGYSYGPLRGFFEEQADTMEISYARTHTSALKMIQYDRADYLLNYQIPADTVIAKKGLGGLKSQVVGKTPIHLFISKQIDGARELANRWDHHLKKLKKNENLPELDYYRDFD